MKISEKSSFLCKSSLTSPDGHKLVKIDLFNLRNPYSEVALTWTTIEFKVNYNSCVTIDMDKDFKAEKASFSSENCVYEACPICFFKQWPSEIQIEGVPDTCNIDSFFFLPNATSMVGRHGKSNIFYSETEENWQIIDKFNQKVGISTSKLLHSGIANWNFTCRDSISTKLNLHKKVKQPGTRE